MRITIMIAIAEPKTYVSVICAAGCGDGVGVGCSSTIFMAVTELDS